MPPLDSAAAAPFDPLAAAGFSQGSDGAYQPPAAGPTQQPSLVPVYGPNGQWIGYQRPSGWSPPATSPEGQSGGGAATPPPTPPPPNAAPTGVVPAAAPTAGAPPASIEVSRGAPPPPAFDPLAAAGFQQAPTGAYLAPGEQPPAAASTEQAAKQLPGQELKNTPWYEPLVSNIKGAIGSLEHGMSMGLDEIVDPIIPAIVSAQRTGKPFTQAYDEEVAKQRVPRTEFQAEHPVAATALTMAGQVPAMVETSPLFGTAGPGASLASKAATLGRNVGASTAVGGGTGFTMTDGDLAARSRGAGEGAAIGAALGPVGDVVTGIGRAVGSPMKAIGPLINPDAAGKRAAGQVLREAAGTPAPVMQPSPTAGVSLNAPQASGNLGLASLLDTLNAGDVPGMKAEQSAQNQGLLAAVPRSTAAATAGGPEPAAAAASAKVENAVRAAGDIIKTEERRVWNTPALTDPNGVSSQTAKDMVEAEVRRMMREEPGLADVLHDPALMRVLKDLAAKPEKLAANQLNGISSRLRSLARDPNSPGDVKLVATRLANAVQEGIWNAPEVAGRAPVQASQAGAPAAPAPTPPVSPTQAAITAGKAPRRPETLVQFLTRKGGVQPDPDLLAAGADTYHHRAGGRLINKNGMTVHEAREAARDEGFPLGNDDHELRNAVAEELSGRPMHRTNDASDVEFWRHADAETAEQERRMAQGHAAAAEAAAQNGVRLTPEAQEHAASLLANDPDMHPEEAVRQAVQEQEDRELGQNAQRSAMGQPGVPLGSYTPPLGTQQLAEGVPPNPQLVRDLKAARAFTQREHEIMGHASFDNILRRNSQGNETGVTGTGMARFFDFANGVEKPGAISNVTKFLDDIRSEWLRLNNASGTRFDPATVAPVMQDLVDGTRDYIMSKMLGRVSSNELDMQGSRMINAAQMSKWIETNRNLLERAGVFTPSQLDALDKLAETGRMIQRGYSLGKGNGSPTFTRLLGKSWLDAFLSPVVSAITGAGIGGAIGGVVGDTSLGVILGAESGALGAQILQRLYSAPRAAAMEWLNRGIRDPQIAEDLMKAATPKSASRFSPATKQWLRSALALQPVAEAARQFGVPANQQQPEAVQ